MIREGLPPRLDFPNSDQNAQRFLVAQMYTDAVFNQDIRIIQTIINRIDGGLPKDIEIDDYQTLFGDSLQKVLSMTTAEQMKVVPEDTVMMALCKSLYDIATTDIYHEYKTTEEGTRSFKKKKPSPEAKQARDTALRLILERTGGRRTLTQVGKELEEVKLADWISALPRKED